MDLNFSEHKPEVIFTVVAMPNNMPAMTQSQYTVDCQ